jgi:hypothetical protein
MVIFNSSKKKKVASIIKAIQESEADNHVIEKMNELYAISPELLLEKVKRDLVGVVSINIGAFNSLVYIDILSVILHNGNSTLFNHFIDLNKKANQYNSLKKHVNLYTDKLFTIFFQRKNEAHLESIFNCLTEDLIDINWITLSHKDKDYDYDSVLHKAIKACIYANLNYHPFFVSYSTTPEDAFSIKMPYFNLLSSIIQKGALQRDDKGELITIVLQSGLKSLLDKVLTISNINDDYIKNSLEKIESINKRYEDKMLNPLKLVISQNLIKELKIRLEKNELEATINKTNTTLTIKKQKI